MKSIASYFKVFVLIVAAISLCACAATPPGQYMARENQPPAGPPPSVVVTPNDQTYVLKVQDHTPFSIFNLPRAVEVMYNKGYDEVRSEREADFSVGLTLSGTTVDNPNVRAGNALGGALLGAATGAIIGGAVGDPGAGAAIGAASGGALGVVAPAATSMVRIDLSIYNFHERQSFSRSRTVDLTNVPPQDVAFAVDNEVARMLQSLPQR